MDELTHATGHTEIVALIRAAFKPASGGLLSRTKIMSLARLNIKNEKWTQAMELLKESQFASIGKTYVYCEVKADRDDDFHSILLDFASIDLNADHDPGPTDSPSPPSVA